MFWLQKTRHGSSREGKNDQPRSPKESDDASATRRTSTGNKRSGEVLGLSLPSRARQPHATRQPLVVHARAADPPSSSSPYSHPTYARLSAANVPLPSPPQDSRGSSPSHVAVEQSEVTLYGEGCRLTVHRTGEFFLWRRDLSGRPAALEESATSPLSSLNIPGPSGDTWTVVTKGHVTLPRLAATHWEFTVHRESTHSCEVRWGYGVKLDIAPVSRSRKDWTKGLEKGWDLTLHVQQDMAEMAEICIDLNRSGWVYGGAHMMRQLWPLNKASVEIGPLFPFDNGPNGINTLVGNNFITSSGLACHVDPATPYLHVGVNAPLTLEGAKRKLETRSWAVGVQNLSREYLPRDAPTIEAVSGWIGDGLLRIQSRKSYADPIMKHPLETWESIRDRVQEEVETQLQTLSEKMATQLDHLVDGMWASPLMTTLSSFGNDNEVQRDAKAPKWLSISVALCATPNVRDAARMSLRTLPKPLGTPSTDVLSKPIWTTWARYKTKIDQQKTLEFAREIVSRDLPRSVMEIDDRWQSAYGDVAFDPKKFPRPREMVEELHKMGFKVTVWVHPFVEEKAACWAEGAKKGYFVQGDKAGWNLKPGFFRWWQPSPVQAIDFTNEEAVAWFVGRLKRFQEETGIDGFKFDAGEPCFLPKNFRTHTPLKHPSEYTQLYMTRVAALFQNGCSEVRTGSRTTNLALLTRMGDRFSTWSTSNGLRSLIPTLLTSSVLGYPFALPDMVGGNAYGFWNRPTPELMARWAQVSALMPALQFSIAPWDFGAEVERVTAETLRIRARLMPELLALAENASRTLHPICRPLWWLDPTDLETHAVSDQFALGDDVIVAPVVRQGERVRDVYLPKGHWVNASSNADPSIIYEGGRWLREVPAPLEVLPIFRRLNDARKPSGPLHTDNLESKFFD